MRFDDKFIADISITLEPFFDEIDWEFLEKKFDLTGSIGKYNNHNIYFIKNLWKELLIILLI